MQALLTIASDPVAITIAFICAVGAGFMLRFLVALLIDENEARSNPVLPKRGPHLVKSVHPRSGNRSFDRENDLALHGFGRRQGG
jgi:hypothetical protein